jgi:hypothetical protein
VRISHGQSHILVVGAKLVGAVVVFGKNGVIWLFLGAVI